MEACLRSLSAEWVQHIDEIQDGNGRINSRVDSPGRSGVLRRPKGCVFPDSDPSGASTVSLVLS